MNAEAEGAVRLVVKNSFLEVVDVPTMTRSYSDSDLSSVRGFSKDASSKADDCNSSVTSGDGSQGLERAPRQFRARQLPLSQLSLFSKSYCPSNDSSPGRSATPSVSDSGSEFSSVRQETPISSYMASGSTSSELDDMQDQSVPVGWSVGSELHASGKCKPCLYMNSKMGCLNGPRCDFCHQPHVRKRRSRPSKTTRMHCKQLVSMIDSASGSPEVMQAAQALAEDSRYLKSILAARMTKTPSSNDAALPQETPSVDQVPAHADVQAALQEFRKKVRMKNKSVQSKTLLGLGAEALSSSSSASSTCSSLNYYS